MEETRVKLGDIRKNEGKYKEMLQGLLTQVTCRDKVDSFVDFNLLASRF